MQVSKELFDQCCEGNAKAQEALYRQCYVPLMRVAMRYTSNEQDAADILNRCFFKVFTKITTFQGKMEQFGAWIRKILVREAIDFVRSQKSWDQRKLSAKVPSSSTSSATEQMIENQNFLHLLQQLPPTTALVFNLFAIEGYAHKEVAKLLNITETNAKWHLHSARKKLKQLLQQTAAL